MTVQLFINFLDGQTPGPLPPQARPAAAPNREPELREWQAIEHIYIQDMFTGADYTGLLSPKFPLKSGLSFDQVVSYVQEIPGHDVYLFDAGPHYRYYSFNLFERVEDAMPGFKAKFTECLDPLDCLQSLQQGTPSLQSQEHQEEPFRRSHRVASACGLIVACPPTLSSQFTFP